LSLLVIIFYTFRKYLYSSPHKHTIYLNYYKNNGRVIFYTMICRVNEQTVSIVDIVVLFTVHNTDVYNIYSLKSSVLVAPKNLSKLTYLWLYSTPTYYLHNII